MQVRRKWQTSLVLVMVLIAPVSFVGAVKASPVQYPDEGWIMDSEGSNQRKLLDMRSALSRPTWSPDGTEVAFSDSNAGLVVVAAAGSTQRTLVASRATGIDWSPDGTSIALSYDPGSGRDIYLIDTDGSNLRRLSNTPGLAASPNWSPDGTMVAFVDVDHEDGTPGHALYVIAADGTGQRQIADGVANPTNMNTLTWSPDATRIAAATHDGDIVVFAADGSGTTNLTMSEAVESSPDWSPGGSLIAFERDGEIYSASHDGSFGDREPHDRGTVTELHDNPKETDSDPQWSPDGTRIAFVMSGDVHSIPVGGGSATNLTDTEFRRNYLPSWSLDSGAIAFIAFETSGRPECDDGIDNDGDGAVDYPDDLDCGSPSDPTETHNDPLIGGACEGFDPDSRTDNEMGGQVIVGTPGNDILTGTEGDDIICGLGGHDLINAGAGNDLVVGNAGNDTIDGGSGKDTLGGGTGDDTIDGGNKNDIIKGGRGEDTLRGNSGWDTVRGGGGNDTLQGGRGSDILRGGRGHDKLKGFAGDDLLNGGRGNDSCRPGRGNDTVKNCER